MSALLRRLRFAGDKAEHYAEEAASELMGFNDDLDEMEMLIEKLGETIKLVWQYSDDLPDELVQPIEDAYALLKEVSNE